jgi:hypothetical protein
MFVIEMGGCDIVSGVEWIRTLGCITMYFLELYTSFQMDGNAYMLKVIKVGSPKIVDSHCMEKLLKKGHLVIIAQFHNIQSFEDDSCLVHRNL